MTIDGNVAIVGSANLDTTLRVPRVPLAGETLLATDSSVTPGGKGANQAVAARVAGGNVWFIGAFGHDAASETLLQSMSQHGVDITGVQFVDDEPTGTATVIVDDTGENVIVVNPGANAKLSAHHVTEVLTHFEADVVLCQLEVPVEAVQAAADHDPRRVFILNPAPMMAVDEIRPLLDRANVVVPNQSELGDLSGRATPTALGEVEQCVRSLDFARSVVVTLGSQGAAVFENVDAAAIHIPAPEVDAVDTSGAGDVFCGALACAVSRGVDLIEATEYAVILAAESTTIPGAQMPVRSPR
ncbi:ribokinase [Bowdeniella massiliensis]|uniref:ribokinase n=1 Tax=Bowdeniella massiliensis TaxID=2932264 RepID=UPI0020287554|nr:ribokinase [Bowdeniella massiliensis]